MAEAGFAHALGKEMIFAAQRKYTIHFDLAGYGFIRWGSEATNAITQKRLITEAKDSD